MSIRLSWQLLVTGFRETNLGRANALFLTSIPLFSALTNPISGWLVTQYSWRGLFFFEGIVSLSLIAIWLPLISERPEDAKWISKEEKEFLITTLAAEKAQADANFRAQGEAKWSYAQLLLNKNLWIMIGLYMCYQHGDNRLRDLAAHAAKETHQDEPDPCGLVKCSAIASGGRGSLPVWRAIG